jgi:hypothetical protein
MTTRLFRSTRVLAVLLASVLIGGTTMRPSLAWAVCGDGTVDAGEACDGGECCSPTCTALALGTACADDGEVCTRDVCDGAGACVHDGSPLSACLVAPKGKLQITNDAVDAKDKLILQMQNAPGISPADFGNPLATDSYHACIFGPDALLMSAEIGPGGTCNGKPCWTETSAGFTYKDTTGSKDGITLLALKASAKPKTKINAKAAGNALPDAPLPFPDAVMAQIVNANTGQCFETYFLEPSAVKKNTAEAYDSKSAAPGFEVPGLAIVVRQDDLDPSTPPAGGENPRLVPPNPTEVFVQSITYDGTGCPEGSVAQSFSADRTSFTLIFDQFVATKGPGVAPSENTKTCQVNLDLKVPQGWQYSIGTVDYRGFVALPKKMKAKQETTYYFDGDGDLASADTTYAGPVSKSYLIRDTLPFSTVVWSSCDVVRPLTMTTQLSLKGGTEPGQISNDSVDGKVKFVLALQWKQCP